MGSSPIIHPKSKAEKPENKEVRVLEMRQQMAHSSLSENAPGGDILLQQMRTKTVKLHTTGNRWYVSYYTKSPSGENIRNRAYGYVNQEKDLTKRMKLLLELQARVFDSLQNGVSIAEKPIKSEATIYKSTQAMINEKQLYLKKTAHTSVKNKLQPWKKWMLESGVATKHPSQISKVDILNFRNWLMLRNISNRSINNTMDEVKALFSFLESNYELVVRNPCKNIDHLPSRSETHVAYTNDEVLKIAEYLKDRDPVLLFYIKLVSYTFLRTKEAKMLKIGDIDTKQWRIMLTAGNNKTSRRVWKLIPRVMQSDFEKMKLDQLPKHYYLFGKKGYPGTENVGVNFFSKRYKKVKRHFGLSDLHTIYGFRHTFVSQLLNSGKRWDEVMKVTGHTTMSSFEKYARSIMALPPQDMSDGFTVKL
ncbi:MAG: tyrosine-type recombinase/integrase [Bacteroidia bacterium]|nr:tyrosine-type recombinase/integrase [Bacteroidia bacterium]